MAANEIDLIVGIAAASASIGGAVLSGIFTGMSQKKLQQFEEEKAEQDARRDYEYEARKRLYNKFEPLLFLFVEQCEYAIGRIYGLANSSKIGKLGGDEHWLSHPGYYTRSTLYRLLAPLAVFKLMQRDLTIFDLNLVPSFNTQYSLAKTLYFTFSADFDLAKVASIPYRPNYDESAGKLPEESKQGVNTGLLDNLVEALIESAPNGSPILLSFGEFEKRFFRPTIKEPFSKSTYLFLNFHPKYRPILWRILIAQLIIYRAIRNIRQSKSDAEFKSFETLPIQDRGDLDWRQSEDEVSADEVLIKPFDDAEKYLKWFRDKWGGILSIS